MIQLIDGPTVFLPFCVFTDKPVHKHGTIQHQFTQKNSTEAKTAEMKQHE